MPESTRSKPILPITMPSPFCWSNWPSACTPVCAPCRGAFGRHGLTPIQYQQAVRIDRSKDLLETSRLPIEDVAERVGYQDRVAFGRVFKR